MAAKYQSWKLRNRIINFIYKYNCHEGTMSIGKTLCLRDLVAKEIVIEK